MKIEKITQLFERLSLEARTTIEPEQFIAKEQVEKLIHESKEEFEELKRLAKIGQATERVFEDGYVLANNNGRYAEYDYISTIEELIK